jgi:hypothetical protein
LVLLDIRVGTWTKPPTVTEVVGVFCAFFVHRNNVDDALMYGVNSRNSLDKH